MQGESSPSWNEAKTVLAMAQDALDARFDRLRQDLRQDIQASAAETRRHFEVLTESLRSEIRVVAEGLNGLDEKVERFRLGLNSRWLDADPEELEKLVLDVAAGKISKAEVAVFVQQHMRARNL